MEMLRLAMKSGLPLIYVRTDDIINIEEVLSFIADESVKPLQIPEVIQKVSDLKVPQGRVFYTSADCKSLVKLYHFCVENEKTIVFVNTEKSVLQFDGGTLVPPKELVLKFLSDISENAEELLPAFGGLTLKDVGEIAKMTMTRDESLTVRGVSETRRGYSKLRGITQVDTALSFYMEPSYLKDWLGTNAKFFMEPVHPSLVPRGLLFDGIPGTGKTLASKHIAATFGVPLYRLDLGAMMGKYVGESEANLNAALAQVDQVEPCVVIFDEVEKIFQSTGDSGVTSRLLSQLLWWLQEHRSKVMSIMTTNNVKKIPEELYREGRIDAVMEFMGIENAQDGYAFAKGAFDSMMKEVDSEGGNQINYVEAYKALQSKTKMLFAGAEAVPQSKLTQEAYTLVKELVSKAAADENKEAA